LDILCNPSAADVVISMQKFCQTIKEAASVMTLTKLDEEVGTAVGNNQSSSKAAIPQHNHGESLSKAIRGFINKTMREIEKHDTFRDLLFSKKQHKETDAHDPSIDSEVKGQVMACLETFIYSKCRGDINQVLREEIKGQSQLPKTTKTLRQREDELFTKIKSLQFVNPSHLDIGCLKPNIDVDLSFSICQLQSLSNESSPRQLLQSILLAYRGISVALSQVVGSSSSIGADDILPTLILGVLRAKPFDILLNLQFIEHFSPPMLLRGEAGYAFTNLCGTVNFIERLDMAGHLAEVIGLEETSDKGVLNIAPDEFRKGLNECKARMKKEEDELTRNGGKNAKYGANRVESYYIDYEESKPYINVKITARDVRQARSTGQSVDLDWALKKHDEGVWPQHIATRSDSSTAMVANKAPHATEMTLLPASFSREYRYLTANPDNLSMADLPGLLKQYKMLVHVTEKLLNERKVWKEEEDRRRIQVERESLERDFVSAVGVDSNGSN